MEGSVAAEVVGLDVMVAAERVVVMAAVVGGSVAAEVVGLDVTVGTVIMAAVVGGSVTAGIIDMAATVVGEVAVK